jgi:hypothetical protein
MDYEEAGYHAAKLFLEDNDPYYNTKRGKTHYIYEEDGVHIRTEVDEVGHYIVPHVPPGYRPLKWVDSHQQWYAPLAE